MLAVATKAGVAETTVWKVENGLSVRWETLHLLLTTALGVQAGTDRYQGMHALWMAQRKEMAEKQGDDFAKKRLPAEAVTAVSKFRSMVRDMDPQNIKRVLAAAQRAAYSMSR